jgi:hypothetical protein
MAAADGLEAVELAICTVMTKLGGGLLVDPFWPSLFVPATPHYFALFAWGSTFGGFALVVAYLLMSVGSLCSFAGSRRRVSPRDRPGAGLAVTRRAAAARWGCARPCARAPRPRCWPAPARRP